MRRIQELDDEILVFIERNPETTILEIAENLIPKRGFCTVYDRVQGLLAGEKIVRVVKDYEFKHPRLGIIPVYIKAGSSERGKLVTYSHYETYCANAKEHFLMRFEDAEARGYAQGEAKIAELERKVAVLEYERIPDRVELFEENFRLNDEVAKLKEQILVRARANLRRDHSE
jgi:hypothetical protein